MNINLDNDISVGLKKSKFFFLTLTFISSIIQTFIGPINYELLFILIIIIFSNIILVNVFFDQENLKRYFFPCVIILAANLFYLSFPLFSKTLLLQNITINLDLPLNSFGISSVYFFSILFSFTIIKNNEEKKILIKKKNLGYLKIFTYSNIKSTNIIFIFFFIIKIYITVFDRGVNSSTEYGDITMKLLYGIDLLFFLPFILYFQLYFFKKEISLKFFSIILFIYLFSSFILGLSTNSRSIMVEGIFTIIICFIFVIIFKKNYFNFKKMITFLISLFILIFIVNYSSDKILDVRVDRANVSTYDIFQKSLSSNVGVHKFDNGIVKIEDYTGFNALDRFNKIKYLDKSLYYSGFLSPIEKEILTKISVMKIISLIPTNIIRLFDQDFNKRDHDIHTGSFIEYNSGIRFGGLKSRASFLNELFIITDSIILSFFITIILFMIFFKVIFFFQKTQNNEIVFSPIIFILIYQFSYAIGADSLGQFFGSVFRLTFQTTIIYHFIMLFNLKLLDKK